MKSAPSAPATLTPERCLPRRAAGASADAASGGIRKPGSRAASALVLALATLVAAAGPVSLRASVDPSTPTSFELPPELASLPVEEAVLTSPPYVPPPIKRDYSARVVVHLEVKEIVRPIDDGTLYTFWTFGGTVPGSFLRVRQGDLIDFHLENSPTSKLPHNIDMHAVTGPGGGAVASFTAPGHSSEFLFRALKPGLYVYHCATAPVPMHIGNGMYGMVLVEPKGGLPPVDREYYVMQGDFYTTGDYGAPGLQSFDASKALDERPTYVLFNGAVGALTGANALTARVGDRVRIYFGDGGPNLTSSFHIIGEIFDRVYPDGTFEHPLEDVQTTVVPPGCATVVEFRVKVPGTYLLVDHAISRAFNKGALGMLKVSGPDNRSIYSGKVAYTRFHDTGAAVAATPLPAPAAPAQPLLPANVLAQVNRGRTVFNQVCFACHQPNGQGVPNLFPPLAGSDLIKASPEHAAHIVTHGLTGPVTVNGTTYNNIMPAQTQLSDEQIADVLTYVLNSWGNPGGHLTAARVHEIRNQP